MCSFMECELSTRTGRFLFEHLLGGRLESPMGYFVSSAALLCELVVAIALCVPVLKICSDALYWGKTNTKDHPKTFVVPLISLALVFY